MYKNPCLCLDAILCAIQRIKQYADGVDHTVLVNDFKLQDAVAFNLQIINTEFNQLPPHYRSAVEATNWQRFDGLFNINIQDYRCLGATSLIEITQKNLPILDQTCRRLRRQAALAKVEKEMVPEDINQNESLEICVISQMDMGALRCRILGCYLIVKLRTDRQDIVPGEIIRIKPSELAPFGEDLCLSGEIISTCIDAPALGLRQLLASNNNEMWNPEGEDWLKGNTEACYQSIMAFGPRLIFQMEQVIPMADVRGRPDDMLAQAIPKIEAGDQRADIRMLIMETLDLDLRCLKAHSLLGYLAFEKTPEIAIKHYEVGVRIGEASLGKNFNGVLQWSTMDNRPFLLCLHGYGLCLWRLGFFEDAAKIFEQMLWFNPSDKLGVRSNLKCVKNGETWRPVNVPLL